ncbi:MAG TPA: hypothetical protein ENN40_05830 [Candidatus Aminicenantes bacterium]|mgnify:CR=1 FL=1|nr:hypothetical protein [Candidatus Aminicenantes bacterium]
MTKEKSPTIGDKVLGPFIIANAIVWGAVILGVAFVLKGSGMMSSIMPVLGPGAVFAVVILPGALAARIKKPLGKGG